jgi:hypothetical protein
VPAAGPGRGVSLNWKAPQPSLIKARRIIGMASGASRPKTALTSREDEVTQRLAAL